MMLSARFTVCVKVRTARLIDELGQGRKYGHRHRGTDDRLWHLLDGPGQIQGTHTNGIEARTEAVAGDEVGLNAGHGENARAEQDQHALNGCALEPQRRAASETGSG